MIVMVNRLYYCRGAGCIVRIIWCFSEQRSLCVIHYIYSLAIGYSEVICICCRCSIRWLLPKWAFEKTPLCYFSPYGQLCYSNDRFPALGKLNITNARNGGAARLSRRCLSVFVCFQHHFRAFCPSSFCSVYLGRVWFPRQAGRVPCQM